MIDFILRKHTLHHIKSLRVDPELLSARFCEDCGMHRCNGRCCHGGVLADVKEKERILAHTELIQKYLEPEQEHDPEKWFDQTVEDDRDFLSGQCDGTALGKHGCVFLDSRGLCALQKTAMAEGMPKFFLKPFFCVAYPVTIDDWVLTVHEPEYANRPECCGSKVEGPKTIFDVCGEELAYMLGAEGVEELKGVSSVLQK
ncbi:MAG TPA: DUF3109 family protein [Bacteroidota bacterium]|nr:DUF3109 family protein [Bacteroidota bacterium]